MGRNIFQSEAPIPMIQAVAKVVHELLKPKQAYEFYQETKSEQERGSPVTRN
jgi:putative autoinducer-2 (AI-2) aldolase